MQTTPSRAAILLGFAAVYVFWGSTYLAIKVGLETIPPFLMSGARYFVAGVVLYAFARIKGAARPALRHWGPAFVIGALLLLCGNGGVVWAETRIASGLAALLVAVEPLFIVLLRAVGPNGKRPTPRALAGFVLALAGVVLLIGPWKLAGERVDLAGAAAVLFAAFAWAVGSLYSRDAPRPASPLVATAVQMLAGGALLTAAGLVHGEIPLVENGVSPRSLAAVLYLVVFGSLIGYTTYIWLLRVADPARVSTYAFVNPVVAVFLGWLIGGEAVSARMLAAATIIVVAVVMITLPEGRRTGRGAPDPKVCPEGA
jgi:drug/metabolite transporter (DMT)-like permease